jgi:ABC-2 type transport system permease protein
MVVSMILGLVMYMLMFIYGMMVMRSVMEEKTNRIVEVMISSVRPFELMLGKIIGVGLVGLTQMLAWAILMSLVFTGIGLVFGADSTAQMNVQAMQMTPEQQAAMQDLSSNTSFMAEIGKINWWYILPLYAIYFLGGYFLYSSLFAAVGSAIGDDMGEAQSFTLPITLPIILALYIAIAASRDPDSSMAFWSSLFPLFSPFVMPARLVSEPPLWEVLLSVSILIASVVGLVWLSGRIYRVGILMYGKKASFKELAKWVFYRD